jgi:hypothetical protein
MTCHLGRGSIPLTCSVLQALLFMACARHRAAVTPDCMATPVQVLPSIQFEEPTTPGTITAMLLDAHRGKPIQHGIILIVGSSPTLGAMSDSTGRAMLQRVPIGRHVLQSRALGYAIREDTLTVDSTAGRALVVQLRSIGGVMC